ncbi:MAG TPA: hypothetical protein VGF91_00890 [Solirubrobacteraceae bacterium]|jgi:hypothetical protein
MRLLALAVGAVMACVIAACGGSTKSARLSHDGYAAAALLAGLAAKQLSEPRSEAPALIRTACAKVRTYADAEAKVMANECAGAEAYVAANTRGDACRSAGNGTCQLTALSEAAAALGQQVAAGRRLQGMIAPGPCRTALAHGTAVDAQLAADLSELAHAAESRDQTGVSRAESALTALTRQALPVQARGAARIAPCRPS